MAKVQIDVCAHVKTRTGDDFLEPAVRGGKFVLVDGKEKQQHQITADDEVKMEPVPVGRVICLGLDAPDEKATPSDLRKRFVLSARVEKAMQERKLLDIEQDERRVIEDTSELVRNGMFLAAVDECLANAQPVKKPAKAA